jgi:hypothetical protein
VGSKLRQLPTTTKAIRRKFRVARAWLWWDVWGRDLIVLVAIGLSLWSTITGQQQLHAQKREQADRIDETCRISETKQRTDVDALRRTYEYLAGLSGKQLDEPLNKAVLANLPSTIREAQVDDAPSYCKAKGVGLPGPSPAIPVKPPGLIVK